MTTFSWLIILQPGWLLSCAVPPPWSRFRLLAGSKASWLLSRAVCHHGPWIQAVPNHAAGTYSSYRGPYLLQYTLKKISCLKWIKIDNCIYGTRQRPTEHFSYSFPSLLWRQKERPAAKKPQVSLFQSHPLHPWGVLFRHSRGFSPFLCFNIALVAWHHCHLLPQSQEWRQVTVKELEEKRRV